MWKKSLMGVTLWLAMLPPSALEAQALPDTRSAKDVPEPGVLVEVVSVNGRAEKVTVQIDRDVSRSRLRTLIDKAAKQGGWSWEGLSTRTMPFTSLWQEATEKNARPRQQTIAQFIARGLVDREGGKLRVAEFVRAFKAYAPVRVTYRIRGPFSLAESWHPKLAGFEIESSFRPDWYIFDAIRTKSVTPGSPMERPRREVRALRILGAGVLVTGTALLILLLRWGRQMRPRRETDK